MNETGTHLVNNSTGNEQVEFHINIFWSVIFEISTLVIVIIGMYFMFAHHEKLEKYKTQKMSLLLLKNYEQEIEEEEGEEKE